mmetsp:Transcript_53305/g.133815  ORF Transcript_53305/g.133815 Transcript_53305/m.133815 type:complete len:416 (-) Transcript_53305:22-1269(-)
MGLQEEFDSVANAPMAQKVEKYSHIISHGEATDADSLRIVEQSIYALGQLYAEEHKTEELGHLLTTIRPFFSRIAKAKTAKIVRTLIERLALVPGTTELQLQLCKESVDWARAENRNFLRQRIQLKLVSLFLETKRYTEALSLVTGLVHEVKRLDDKAFLVEIHLLESQIHHALVNIPKAKAALTSARTCANAIYCPPSLQGQLELQSGKLHSEEKDYKTAFSYFYESFETFDSISSNTALTSLKYMLLCKIMLGKPEDVHSQMSGKTALKYTGEGIEAMKAIATAYSNRSVKEFEAVLRQFKSEIQEDSIVSTQLTELYNTLLEENLLRIIEPYSCVEIPHVAHAIQLDLAAVEKKLSQMILDKKLHGILDQGNGCLNVFNEPVDDKIYPDALETIANVGRVVDVLYDKVKRVG